MIKACWLSSSNVGLLSGSFCKLKRHRRIRTRQNLVHKGPYQRRTKSHSSVLNSGGSKAGGSWKVNSSSSRFKNPANLHYSRCSQGQRQARTETTEFKSRRRQTPDPYPPSSTASIRVREPTERHLHQRKTQAPYIGSYRVFIAQQPFRLKRRQELHTDR